MALQVHRNTRLLSGALVLLLGACATAHQPGLSVSDLLQHPDQFNQNRVLVSGCLIAHTTSTGDRLLVLATNCGVTITSDFNLVSAKVLDVTASGPSEDLPLGPTAIDATFKQYGRDPLNIKLSGVSQIGELVIVAN